jgi:hypothetical protein
MRVATHVDPTANFSKYRSFEIKRGLIVRNGAVDPRATDIQASVENALKEELMRKGLVPSAENPDIFVTYTQGARTRQELEQVWIYGGYGWAYGPHFIDIFVEEHTDSTFVVDVIDATEKRIVWRSIVKSVDQDFGTADYVRRVVKKALEKYPSGSQGGKTAK